jgi:hypothetical protein
MDAGDAQFFSRSEFEHCPSRLCGGSLIDVKGDARIGEGELDARKMNNVAPDQKPLAVGLN